MKKACLSMTLHEVKMVKESMFQRSQGMDFTSERSTAHVVGFKALTAVSCRGQGNVPMGHRPQRQCCDTSHTEVSIFIYPAHPTGANKQVKLTPSRLRPSPISLGWIPVRGSGRPSPSHQDGRFCSKVLDGMRGSVTDLSSASHREA